MEDGCSSAISRTVFVRSVIVAIAAAILQHGLVSLALLTAVAGHAYDLSTQRNAAALQRPLASVGRRALALSSVFSVLLILGLW